MNGIGEKEIETTPDFCPKVHKPGFHCLENNCKHHSYTYAPYEIAYADKNGLVPDSDCWIGFGGDMEPEDYNEEKITNLKKLWRDVCKAKIEEAYEEFMQKADLKNK
ncbi:hypothetical protein [Neobacillus endophyticus]|uniref:hypothetical protein n=1 Tax=Neobacillus endophyticus TaxID=2738405 RepID=UPI001FE77BD5|nr:hypothetical protein [Neobacillus endophyticus]